MQKILSTFGVMAFLATVHVGAMPQPVPGELSSTDDIPLWNLTRRQDPADSNVEIGDRNVVAQDLNAQPGQSPAAFGQLWDAVENSLCTDLGCDVTRNFCVTASTGQDVCITADGEWGSVAMRADFINGARGLFNRSIRRQDLPSGVIETATDLVHLVSMAGANSGWGLRVQLTNQDSEGGGQCPDVVNFIASGGASFPEVGTVFGTLAFLCGATEQFRGEATG